MAFTNHGRFNWGCLASAILGVIVLPALFGGLMFGGGGCEGRPSPCDGDFTHVWIIMGLAIAGLAMLCWLINKLLAVVLGRGDNGGR
ncbi:hypothetical protein [Sphingobium ummariense]